MTPISIDPKTGAPIQIPSVSANESTNESPTNPPVTNPLSSTPSKDNPTHIPGARTNSIEHNTHPPNNPQQNNNNPPQFPEGPRTDAPLSVGGTAPTNPVNESNSSFAPGDKNVQPSGTVTPHDLGQGIGNPNTPLDAGKLNPNLPKTRTPDPMVHNSSSSARAASTNERIAHNPVKPRYTAQINPDLLQNILYILKNNGMDSQQQQKSLDQIGELLQNHYHSESEFNSPETESETEPESDSPNSDFLSN